MEYPVHKLFFKLYYHKWYIEYCIYHANYSFLKNHFTMSYHQTFFIAFNFWESYGNTLPRTFSLHVSFFTPPYHNFHLLPWFSALFRHVYGTKRPFQNVTKCASHFFPFFWKICVPYFFFIFFYMRGYLVITLPLIFCNKFFLQFLWYC